ncbi:MAG: arylamine N-acetyltransferase [Pseudomonadales bacterium]|nr:arylamine N-acetyltransferase [Pseudomonadales bacterium]
MLMQTPMNPAQLDAYCQRIGYSGSRVPDLETLRAIIFQHTRTIAFENLSSFLGQTVDLDLPSLIRKLVTDKRGGYCFEHNLLLGSALNALGYQVTGLAARVLWGLPEPVAAEPSPAVTVPRTHMLLQLDIDGQSWLADAGFGGLTLTAPLLIVPDIEQTTPHEPFRLLQEGKAYRLQARLQQSWKTLYVFTREEQQFSDYTLANWYVATHPGSRFVTGLIAARPEVDKRYALADNHLSLYRLSGETERYKIATVAELRETLQDLFGLSLSNMAGLEEGLGRLLAEQKTPASD